MSVHFNRSWLAGVIACVACSAAVIAAVGQVAPAAGKPVQAGSTNAAAGHSVAADAGEKVFMANCSRCHVPPMTLGPRVTGAVIQHMRVRARLSTKDQQLLLKYLAP
jgi:cytochrome c5